LTTQTVAPAFYQLLDSGEGKLLEQWGRYRLQRPAHLALWPRQNPDSWKATDAIFEGRLDGGRGKWLYPRHPFKSFQLSVSWSQIASLAHHYQLLKPPTDPLPDNELTIHCELTPYGHMGLFIEQVTQWHWLLTHLQPEGNYLNAFAYTGMFSLLMRHFGITTHVDASKATLQWAKRNADSNPGPFPVKWIQEDVMRYLSRVIKRQQHFHGIVIDPPTFGRGPKGQVWKIEDHLMECLTRCREALAPDWHFFLVMAHTPGYSHHLLKNCLSSLFPDDLVESGEMILRQNHSSRCLPSGCFARVLRKKSTKL